MQTNKRKLIVAIVILALFIGVSVIISSSRPMPLRKPDMAPAGLEVSTMKVVPQRYTYMLNSFGTVQPRTQSLLVSQVSGEIKEVSESFRDGGYVNQGDVLIRIDDRDYQSALQSARANLLQAQSALEQEKAQAQQAALDWQRLGDGDTPPDLVLRKPQLAAAQATLLSAQAAVNQAELDLERTQVKAPYDGRVLNTTVDLGQYVNSNATLGELFATDVVEIRLPLKDADLSFIELPSDYRGASPSSTTYPPVSIISHLGGETHWQGQIVRAEAALDETSHQLYVVAQIERPFAADHHGKEPLKIGQYVTARIQGVAQDNVLVVPESSVYQGSYVYTVVDNRLQRTPITIAFQTADEVVVSSGIEANAEVVISPLGQVVSGTPIKRSAVAGKSVESTP